MSHYTVAVFTKNKNDSIKKLLAPYDENIQVAPYVERTKAQIIQYERDELQKDFDGPYSEWQKDSAVYKSKCKNPQHITYLKTIPNRMKWSDEKLYKHATEGLEDRLTENGDLISTYNPKSKWDGWEIGGRWENLLILKDKRSSNAAYMSDIDFSAMRVRDLKELTPYNDVINDSYFKEEYMREKFPTEDEYINRSLLFTTYAVVTPYGVWHEAGKMGWWGVSCASPKDEREWDLRYYKHFIEPASEHNWYMTIVDCHI